MAYSNGYIIGFATAVCVVCSIFVAGSAVSLKEQQVKNAVLDLKKNVISVSDLQTEADKATPLTEDQVNKFFDPNEANHIEEKYVELATGITLNAKDGVQKMEENKDNCTPLSAKENKAKISCLPKYKRIYEIYKDKKMSRMVLEVEGKGLWSTLQGFLAMSTDGQTIQGLTFYKHGETPGLGGEVDNPKWKSGWVGAKPFNASNLPSIDIVKGSAPDNKSDNKIDGLSGATLTSNGVEDLVNFWLGTHGYATYLSKNSKGGQ